MAGLRMTTINIKSTILNELIKQAISNMNKRSTIK